MYIGWDTIITAASVMTAVGVIVGAILWCYKWYLKVERKAAQHDELKEQHDADVKLLNEENYLIIRALSACLDGLVQQGCNHTVPETKKMIDDYLNRRAHE